MEIVKPLQLPFLALGKMEATRAPWRAAQGEPWCLVSGQGKVGVCPQQVVGRAVGTAWCQGEGSECSRNRGMQTL